MTISTEQLANDIRQLYASDRSQAEALIESYLERRLNELSVNERLAVLERLTSEFDGKNLNAPHNTNLREDILPRLFSLLLGRKVSQVDLSSPELLERLAESLNTVFDILNNLVSVINSTLFGESAGEETIRDYLLQSKSLESYLGQISKAFLTAQQASKRAVHTKMEEILLELDPGKMASSGGGGFKIGPLRKADSFDMYAERYHKCRDWFESGRFMEDFLREFEKNCREIGV